ncbi:MAG: hypothetical protein HFF62_11790 [Oscillospiraceae bacterium]|nr:hypothetical protein [Oscillospiraceae bacterium]
MKRTKVKIISAIMLLVMVISTSPGAFAADVSTPAENEIFVQFDGHGQYTEVDSAVRTDIVQASNVQEVGCVVAATATDDKDLYLLSQNDYLLRVGAANDENRTFLHVERTDIDDFSVGALGKFGFPSKVAGRITNIVDRQTARGNRSLGLSVFLPASGYYTRSGQQFTDSYIKYWNLEYSFSSSQKSGNAWKTARAAAIFLLDCAGLINRTAATLGCSALQTLADALDVHPTAAGNRYGVIQTVVTYDAATRVTYWNKENGFGRDPYVSTCKTWLDTDFTQQTCDDYPGGAYQAETYLNEEICSPHYDAPSDWLYNDYYAAAGTVEGPIFYTIHNQRFVLA